MNAEKAMGRLRGLMFADPTYKAALQRGACKAKPGKPARGGDFTKEQRTWAWNFVRRHVWPLETFLQSHVLFHFPAVTCFIPLSYSHMFYSKATAFELECPVVWLSGC